MYMYMSISISISISINLSIYIYLSAPRNAGTLVYIPLYVYGMHICIYLYNVYNIYNIYTIYNIYLFVGPTDPAVLV